MILSQKHKFLMVSGTKTGTTSIERSIGNFHDVGRCVRWQDKHMKYADIKKKYPQVGDYFKFSFVRNPWDWVVSWYAYRKNSPNKKYDTTKVGFKDWLMKEGSVAYDSNELNLSMTPFGFICNEGGEIELDFVGRFENLQNDFDIICERVGISKVELPVVNVSSHGHYVEYYDDETREHVGRYCAKEIEYFGYEFRK